MLFSVNALATENEKLNVQHRIIESAISQIESNLSAESFDTAVQNKYHSTYHFLNKLSQKQKQEVYEYYQNESNFSTIRHKIFELFFGVY